MVNIVDAAHLERNLYLTLQLIELGVPLLIDLNMNRYADGEGVIIDTKMLSRMFGVPVVRIEAIDNTVKDQLIQEILGGAAASTNTPHYSSEIEQHLTALAEMMPDHSRWDSIHFLIHGAPDKLPAKVKSEIEETRRHLSDIFGTTPQEIFADQWYRYIAGILHDAVHYHKDSGVARTSRNVLIGS